MFSRLSSSIVFFICICASHPSFAALHSIRWTLKDDSDASLTHVLQVANQKLGTTLSEQDLQLEEEQDLGTWKFQIWNQTLQGLPVKDASLRIWKNISNGQLVQAEAQFENPNDPLVRRLILSSQAFNREAFSRIELTALVKSLGLQKFRNYRTEDLWHPQYGPVRRIHVFATTYSWEILKSLKTGQILSKVRHDYPRGDTRQTDEFELPAQVYQTPEETYVNGVRTPTGTPRTNVTLKYLKRQAAYSTQNPLASFAGQVFAASKQDESKGQTADGQAQGFWSMAYLKQKIQEALNALPLESNEISDGQSYLVGRFVTVQIHPEARQQFQPSFPMVYGTGASFNWTQLSNVVNGQPDWGMSIGPTHMGLPGHDFWDFYNRPAPWRLEAKTADLMNEGYDEVQVYWTVNQWFETLHDLGFNDPQISTRPITAILFNPDVEARDNAYYDNDTINFATYSADSANAARDTETIWHELGHGLEDRILKNANYDGGLSEGMADLDADMILNAVTKGQDYPGRNDRRIVNHVGFNLTNEEHDNGESYGGTMFELSEKILKAEGLAGFRKFADLVYDSMRLSRDNPKLDTQEWFRHVLFADELGKPGVRQPGEFAARLQDVLNDRNFSFTTADIASFPIQIDGIGTLDDKSPGSRYNSIAVDLAANQSKVFHLKVSAQDGQKVQFKYPVTVRVSYNGGPLQGSARFQGEDQVSEWTLAKSGDQIDVPVTVLAGCDQINRNDRRCSDFAYIQLYNAGDSQPTGKKRFYVNVNALNP